MNFKKRFRYIKLTSSQRIFLQKGVIKSYENFYPDKDGYVGGKTYT